MSWALSLETLSLYTARSAASALSAAGAQTVIEALLERVGAEGTVMMPTQSWKNLDPESGVHWEEPREWWQAIRDNWPAYDPDITPTNTMGAVAEMFRRWPGARRSGPSGPVGRGLGPVRGLPSRGSTTCRISSETVRP